MTAKTTEKKNLRAIRPDRKLQPTLKQYQVVGRGEPTEADPSPKIYRMRLFSRNEVVAKSRFWYYMSRINKIKKSRGQILEVTQLYERKPGIVKNFGIWLRYDSRTGTHNMYKEFRDVTQAGAVEQMVTTMTGNHRALTCNIEVIRVMELKDSECKRQQITQFHAKKLRFPMIRQIPRIPKEYKNLYEYKRPMTYRV